LAAAISANIPHPQIRRTALTVQTVRATRLAAARSATSQSFIAN
jgi:hypothetical protein